MFIRFDKCLLLVTLCMFSMISCANSSKIKYTRKKRTTKKVAKVELPPSPSPSIAPSALATQTPSVQGMRLPNMMEMPKNSDLQASNPDTPPSPSSSPTGSAILARPNAANPEIPNQPNQ